MNKIVKLHLEAIKQNIGMDYETNLIYVNKAASKTAEVTEQVAIKFHNWMNENDTEQNAERFANFSDKDMFQEFLKTQL